MIDLNNEKETFLPSSPDVFVAHIDAPCGSTYNNMRFFERNVHLA